MKLHRETLLAGIVLALVIGVGLRAPAFVTLPSLLGVLTDTSLLFMLTLAQMGVLLTRGIDLSVAANLALTGMVAGLVNHAAPGLPILAIIALAIVFGAVLGLFNATLIAGLGIPPIVVTLGTLAIYRGAIFLIARGAWLTSKDMSPAFLAMPKAQFLGLSSLVWIAAAVAIGAWIFLNHTTAGRGALCRRRKPRGGPLLRHRPRASAAHSLRCLRRGVGALRLSLGVALWHRLFRHRSRL